MGRKFRGGVVRPALAGGLLAAAMVLAPASGACADWLNPERQLTPRGRLAQTPEVSGNRVVYSDHSAEQTLSDGTMAFDIRVRNLSTGTDLLLTPHHTATGRAAISGTRVVWADHGSGPDTGLWYADLASGERRRLSAQPGDKVAISGLLVCYEYRGRVRVYNLRTGADDAVSPASASAADCAIAGSTVVWQDDRNGQDLDIYARDLGSGVETRVTSDPGDQSMPQVDGHTVVWQDDRNGENLDIYAFDLATRTESLVTGAAGRQWLPGISAGRVVWMDERLGHDNTEIFAYDLASGVETRVTTSDGWSGNPSISGSRIVYEEARADGHNLFQRVITPPELGISLDTATQVDQPSVTGRLLGAGGVPLVAATVHLESSTDGVAWHDAGPAVTSGDGSYVFDVPGTGGTVWLRVRFSGSPEYAQAVSPRLQAGQR